MVQLHHQKYFFSLGTTKFGSTFNLIPIPSHSSQAPKGLLNENNLGSISSIVKPLSGQANLVENIKFSNFLNFFGKFRPHIQQIINHLLNLLKFQYFQLIYFPEKNLE